MNERQAGPEKVDEFRANLESGENSRCIAATAIATKIGPSALKVAAQITGDPRQSQPSRYWALQALSQFGEEHRLEVVQVATQALSDPYAGIRSIALQILAQRDAREAIEPITRLLIDSARDPTCWTDDPRTIADAAAEALRKIQASC